MVYPTNVTELPLFRACDQMPNQCSKSKALEIEPYCQIATMY